MNITVSSHILDSTTGGSAIGIRVQLFTLASDGSRQCLLDTRASDEGRVVEAFDIASETECELVFHSASFFGSSADCSPVQQAVLRFTTRTDQTRYHLPVMLAPHSYSVWWSA